jgi:hypothetical protein
MTAEETNRNADVMRRVKDWRAHPNYHKVCRCGHRSILHVSGEGRCGHVGLDQSPDCACEGFRKTEGPQ